jgi:AraC-like DNA-binding protein
MTEPTQRVVRSRSEEGRWELADASPAPELRGLVAGDTGFVEKAERLRRREAPRETVTVIVNFGVPLEIGAPGVSVKSHRASFVARLSSVPATTEFTGTSAGVQVDFSPLGAHMFFGLAMDELPEPVVSLEELLGAEGRRLTEALEAAAGWESRFEVLDAAIARRVAAARAPSPSVDWAWRTLQASAGGVEIGRLAERLGCSRRHLIAGFRQQVGVPPKTAARIIRFDRTARALRAGPGVGLARIATEFGYHDQSHMTREFSELAGMTPAAYTAAGLPGYLGVGPS